MINQDYKVIGVYILESESNCINAETKKKHLIIPNKIAAGIPRTVITNASSKEAPVFNIELNNIIEYKKLPRCIIYSYDEYDREKYPDIDIQKDIITSIEYIETFALKRIIENENIVSDFNKSGGLINFYNRANDAKILTVRFINSGDGKFSSPSCNSYSYIIKKTQLASIIHKLNEKNVKLIEPVGDINNYSVASFKLVTNIKEQYKNLVYIENIHDYNDSYYNRSVIDDFIYSSQSLIFSPGLDFFGKKLKKKLYSIFLSDYKEEEENINSFKKEYECIWEKPKEERKGNSMKSNTLFKDVQFGRAKGVVMSIYGPAFPTVDNEDEYIAYSKKDDEWIDVSPMIFDRDITLFYAMPVAKDDLAVGNFIFHNGGWVRVIDFDEALRPVVETPKTKTVNTILPTRNMFGFDFYTKLISPFGDMMDCASADKPFGNILPFMLLQDSNSADFLPMLLLSQGGEFDISNPMMLYFLMKDGKNSDILPFLMMGMMNK